MTIKKVLIANRGEIAVRILKTLKRLNLQSVIVYHATDAGTPAVEMADEKVELMGDLPVAAYLDMEQIIQACKLTNADAVHPGFGFLSENAEFVRQVKQNDITFIGPSSDTIELMGNKVKARAFCIEHGFPIAPSVVDEGDEQHFINMAKEIGVPLLIKAAAGGGGKGMQIVRDADQIESAISLARGEALRSFGDSLVYAERYVDTPRHIEVQVLADEHGNVIHLGERECSIQRRFQKVVEEAPSATLTPEQREKICSIAVNIAEKSGYANAGTVEFIYAPDGEFYFLEMNTRIQVEHPVTEMVTGVDLVEEQINVANGQTLSKSQDQIQLNGHSIEIRLYAEDANDDFAPSIGTLLKYQLPEHIARCENGFVEGQQVTSAYDPMLSKIIVHGENREQATAKMIEALQASTVLGVTTNRDFLIRVLQHPAYAIGETHTGFIAEHLDALLSPELSTAQQKILLGITALMNSDLSEPTMQAPQPYVSIGEWRNL